MKPRYTATLGMLAGIGIGAFAVQAIHAQSKPPLYLVAHIDVTNTDGYMKEYGPLIRASIKEAGGRLVSLTVRGGTEQRSRFVIVKTAAGL